MGNGFEGDTYGGVQPQRLRDRETEKQRDKEGEGVSQFSISRMQPSRFNCCKPSILIRTKNYFPFPLHCCCCCYCLCFVCFQFAANVLDFIDFNCCIAKTIDYNARRKREREREREQAGYLTDCREQWTKSFRTIKCVSAT